MTSSPLVSIIIPVYNVAKVLERCLESVLAQTYPSLEIILINDGSTDMSGKFCDIYAKKDPRIKVIHQPNSGLSAARNAGLKIAKGDYITFVDSDDSISNDLISTLVELCEFYHTKMSICSFREIFPDDASSPVLQNTLPKPPIPARNHFATNPNISILSTLDCLVAMLSEEAFSMSAWGKLYSRKLFRGITFPVGKLHEDVGTTYKLVLECPKIALTSAKLYNYFQNSDSITNQPFSLRKLDLVELTDQMCNDLVAWSKSEPPETIRKIRYLTEKRRAHARFSILRQLVTVKPSQLSAADRRSFYKIRRATAHYLRQHKNYVLDNPLASQRDRLAMRSLQLGLPVFKRAWLIYQNRKRSKSKTQKTAV